MNGCGISNGLLLGYLFVGSTTLLTVVASLKNYAFGDLKAEG